MPLRRFCSRDLNLAALVIGSMTPDLGYFVRFLDFATSAHTFKGSFTVCLPTGLVLLIIFYLVRSAVCFILPMPHRGALAPLSAQMPEISLRNLGVALLSLLLGAWSHILWDSFTHRHGWFVQRISFLQQPVVMVGSIPLSVYYVLQQFSTIAGAGILVIVYLRWLRRQPFDRPSPDSSDRWRYFFLGLSLFLALLIALFWALHVASGFYGFLAFRVFAVQTVVEAVSVGTSLIVLGALAVRACGSSPS